MYVHYVGWLEKGIIKIADLSEMDLLPRIVEIVEQWEQ